VRAGAVGRADLLRALAAAPRDLGPRDHLTLDDCPSGWFGYVRRDDAPPLPAVPPPAAHVPRPAVPATPTHRLPLRMPFAWCVVHRETRAPPADDLGDGSVPRPFVPDDPDLVPASSERRIDFEPLVPNARLLPALRRHLGAVRTGPLDLPRLTRALAAGRVPRRLPRRVLRRWHPDLVVVLDFARRLTPYLRDMHRLADALRRRCGGPGLSLRILEHGPAGPWSDWQAVQAGRALPPERPWTMPPPGTPVLIVGDLGLLSGAGSPPARAWARFVADLRRAGARPCALVPLGAGQVAPALTRALPVLRWSLDAPAHPTRGQGGPAQPLPDGLNDLLAMVAAVRRIDLPLLRALRRLTRHGALNAGLEGALWVHPDTEASGFSVQVRDDRRERHLRHFTASLADRHRTVDSLRRTHHAHLPAVLEHEETLLWATHADPWAVAADPEAEARIDKAKDFLGRLAETLSTPASTRAAGDWLAVAHAIVRRADRQMAERHRVAFNRLADRVHALAGERSMPGWADPALLARGRTDAEPVLCALVEDAATGRLRLQAGAAGPRQRPLAEPVPVDAGGVRVGGPGGDRWVAAEALPIDLAPAGAPAGEPASLRLETATHRIELAAVRRPRGAEGWHCGRGGIEVASAPLAGHRTTWRGPALHPIRHGAGWVLEADPVPYPAGDGTVSLGIDAAFGVYADLTVATGHRRATQRFRWIEPGRFRMGSPEDEPERFGNEGPRHWVTLTQGFWLADTACTQALWQAVTGANPSRFTGNVARPVERVSWDDVQGFLRRLEDLVPGCRADLPTEAEWEYACRAGTESPFSFGRQITPEQVNYGGSHPYAGRARGLGGGETVPVRSLPPNPWGLYEMHGNVWECCADGLRPYDSEERVDPRGPDLADRQEEPHRALRGGSWFGWARNARSADRGAYRPLGLARDSQGFRPCLRSVESGQDRNGPEGPAEGAPGGHPAAPPRDEAERPANSGACGSRTGFASANANRIDQDEGPHWSRMQDTSLFGRLVPQNK